MRMRWACAVAVFVAASGAVVLGQATPTTVNEVHIPFTASLVNPCNGEIVVVEGTTHALISTTFDNTGGMHLKLATVDKGTGFVHATGTQYVFSEENESELSTSGQNSHVSSTNTINRNLNSAGTEPNLIVRSRFHLTITANGMPTASVSEFEADCRG